MNKTNTQANLILRHLQSGERVNASDAESWWGVKRLAARIGELRTRGYNIESTMRSVDGVRFASYRLTAKPAPPCDGLSDHLRSRFSHALN